MTLHPAFRVAGHLIRRAFQAHDAIFARETAGYDVTSPQVATLIAIQLRPGIELTPLADWVGYDAGTQSGLVNRLIVKRLVRRAVGKHDRRTRQLFLTTKGERLLAEVTPRANRVTDVLLEPLSPAEREVWFDMMERIMVHAAAISQPIETEVA